MKSFVSPAVVLAGVILSFGVSSVAHHSTPPYWKTTEEVEISGIVKQMKIINPHSELLLTVTEADGTVADYVCVGGTGNGMIKAGWTNETLAVGTHVRVQGAPPRREGARGILIRSIILDDGTVLTSGSLPS